MIELFLVQNENENYFTFFWNKKKYYWPDNIISNRETVLNVASKDAVIDYRKIYKELIETPRP